MGTWIETRGGHAPEGATFEGRHDLAFYMGEPEQVREQQPTHQPQQLLHDIDSEESVENWSSGINNNGNNNRGELQCKIEVKKKSVYEEEMRERERRNRKESIAICQRSTWQKHREEDKGRRRVGSAKDQECVIFSVQDASQRSSKTFPKAHGELWTMAK